MKKIRMLTLLVALCSAVESQASFFTLIEKNGETTCSVPQAETILKFSLENEITVRKGFESAVFEATMQHLEVLQADDVELYEIESLVTANIVAKKLSMITFWNLVELKIDDCEHLTLLGLSALTKLMGPLAKKTLIGGCTALPQLDVTGCEDLELSGLSALEQIVGPLPKKAEIRSCELSQLNVTGCENLQLYQLWGLTEITGPLPKKSVIEGCTALPEMDVTGCEDLKLAYLYALTKLVGTLPKKTVIERCNALPPQLDVTGCEDLELRNLDALKKLMGPLPKKAEIRNCNALPELNVTGCEDLQLSGLDALTKLVGPLPKKALIGWCNALPELNVTGCEDLCLWDLPALAQIAGLLPKKTGIEWCRGFPHLDVTGCEDLKLSFLDALAQIAGLLPKKTKITWCKALPQLDVTGCEDLYLYDLPQLEKLSGTVPVKATITNCPQLKEIEKVAFDAQGNPEESAALVNFLKDKTSANLPPSLSYLTRVGACDMDGNPIGDNTENLTSILENVKVVLKGTYSLDQFFDIVTAASENKKGFYLEVDPECNFHLFEGKPISNLQNNLINMLTKRAPHITVENKFLKIRQGDEFQEILLPKAFQREEVVIDGSTPLDYLRTLFQRKVYSGLKMTLDIASEDQNGNQKDSGIKLSQNIGSEENPVLFRDALATFIENPETQATINFNGTGHFILEDFERLLISDFPKCLCRFTNIAVKEGDLQRLQEEQFHSSLERILKSFQGIAQTKHYSFYLDTNKTDDNIYIFFKEAEEEEKQKIFTCHGQDCAENRDSCDDIFALEKFALPKYYEHISPEQLKDIAKKCGIQDHESQ